MPISQNNSPQPPNENPARHLAAENFSRQLARAVKIFNKLNEWLRDAILSTK